MISYRYIKNLRDNAAHKTHDVSVIQKIKPKFANKADFRTCG